MRIFIFLAMLALGTTIGASEAFAAKPAESPSNTVVSATASGGRLPSGDRLDNSKSSAVGSVWCVATTATGTGAPCANATAITSIQAAVTGASAEDEIRVAGGTFTGSGPSVVIVDKALAITGGYPGGVTGWATPTDNPNITVVDGQGLRTGFQVQSGVSVHLRNLTVSNGGISNSGTVIVSAYTLQLINGGTTGGSYSIASGAKMDFAGGSHTLQPGTAFSGAGKARVIAGTTTVNGTANADNFELSNGTIGGAGTLNIGGTFDWLSGAMDGTGITNVAVGATMNLGGNATTKQLLQRTFNNNGSAFMNGTGIGSLLVINGATFNNNAGATLTIQNDDAIASNSGLASVLNNAGTIRKTAGTGISILGNGTLVMSNSGTIQVQSGTISLESESTDTGAFSASVGATLRFGGNNHSLGPTSSVSIAGTIEFRAGTTNIAGSYNVTGTTLMTGGTVLFTGPGTIHTLTLNNCAGIFRFGGTLNVTVLNWTCGTIDGSDANPNNRGTLNIVAGGSITLGGVSTTKSLVRATINNNGTATMNTTGQGALVLSDGSVFNNGTAGGNGMFDIRNNDDIVYGSGVACAFNNNATGTLNKSLGNGTSVLGSGFLAFNNAGTTNIITGTLSLEGGNSKGESHTGAFAVSSGANLSFNGAENILNNTASITGPGNVEFRAGTVGMAGTYSISGSTNVIGGIANFNSNTPATTVGTNISAGSLSGTGIVTATGTFNWTGGMMSGTGVTYIAPSGTMNLGGVNAGKVLFERTLINYGTIRVNGTGAGVLRIGAGATFNNGSSQVTSALLEIRNNDDFVDNGGVASVINNHGTVQKALGADISVIGTGNLTFNNYGMVDILTGTLSLDAGTSDPNGSSGAFVVAASSRLRFGGGNHTLRAGSSISGAGNVEFLGGTVDLAGTYNIAGSSLVTGGTVNFNSNAISANASLSSGTLAGTAVFTVTGTLNWTASTMSGGGITNLAPGGTLILGGVGQVKSLRQRTFNNYGAAYVNGTNTGALDLGDGATFNNASGALYELQNNDSVRYSGGEAPTFNNNGIVRKSGGSGITTLGTGNLAFNNSGLLQVLTGTVSFDGGGNGGDTSSGAFQVASSALLRFNAGSHTLEATSSITGTGDVLFNGGTTVLDGSYDIGGTTRVAGGMVSFNDTSNTRNAIISGGILAGTGDWTASGTVNW